MGRSQSKAEAAIRLEQLWDEIARTYETDILCGYPLSGFHRAENSHFFQRIYAEHFAGASAEVKGMPVKEIVEHVETLQRLGYGVMIFRTQELYRMSRYASRYTRSRIHFAIGLTVLVRVFEDRYKDLAGTLLEGIARLFTQNVRLNVYPMPAEEVRRRVKAAGLTGWRWKEIDGMVSADNLHPSGPLESLYQYLLSSEFILPGKPGER